MFTKLLFCNQIACSLHLVKQETLSHVTGVINKVLSGVLHREASADRLQVRPTFRVKECFDAAEPRLTGNITSLGLLLVGLEILFSTGYENE